ncbi:MAG: hypothetical protein MJK10_20975, partial [Pseudomonadales bacterium]|nr:hypothetical protein [Pseudomonadales bacterium]
MLYITAIVRRITLEQDTTCHCGNDLGTAFSTLKDSLAPLKKKPQVLVPNFQLPPPLCQDCCHPLKLSINQLLGAVKRDL